MDSIIGITEAYKEYDQFKIDKSKLDEVLLEDEKNQAQNKNIKTIKNNHMLINKFIYKINKDKSIINENVLSINYMDKIVIIGETGLGNQRF
ncbi:hypothetical protein FHQ23_12300 [Testudinibacter sp. TR-2022]|uniref:hypothetical protein n=2 Tax=Testudinibacter sp. TR-2022 TaxID=2585029 RepID=UPI00111BACD0|nr:hypothetical protein [Testudinibacter sp. TR-2022]TNH12971.1 hypothetical protein FHQ23_12300 [Testudinibacter sp. TR-2022]